MKYERMKFELSKIEKCALKNVNDKKRRQSGNEGLEAFHTLSKRIFSIHESYYCPARLYPETFLKVIQEPF